MQAPRRSPSNRASRQDTEVLRQALAVFELVADLEEPERTHAVVKACRGDAALRAVVEGLLAFHSGSDSAEAAHGTRAFRSVIAGGPGAGVLVEGASIGAYTLLGRAGAGGMGVVYRAQQRDPERIVALKVLRFELQSDHLAARFRREVRLLAQLQHPGIAQVFDTGTIELEHGSLPYFAMEFIDGPPIDVFAADRRLGVRARCQLVADVCDAVHHAHTRGVVHRDLKPSNIMVVDLGGGRFQPRVIDFGIARAAGGDSGATELRTLTGQFVGTLSYMSPEQVQRGPDVDARADVYAIGVLLYELLTGRLPLDLQGRPVAEVARILEDEEPTRLGRIDAALRGDLETVVATALAKDPDRRYPTAAALAEDLRRFLEDAPIRARPASAFYYLRKSLRRHRVFVSGVAATGLALAGGLVAALALAEQNQSLAASERSLRIEAERATVEAEGARTEADGARADAEAVRDELRRTLYRSEMRQIDDLLAGPRREKAQALLAGWEPRPGEDDLRGFEWHLAHAIAFTDELVVPDLRDTELLWTADGIESAADGRWVSIDPATGAMTARGAGSVVSNATLSTDARGETYAYCGRSTVVVGARSTGRERTVFSVADELGTPCGTWVSGDGRFVAAMLQAGTEAPDRFVVVSTESGSVVLEPVPVHAFGSRAIGFSPCGRFLASAAHRGLLRLWDTETWHELAPIEVLRAPRMDHGQTLGWSPDGARVAVGGRRSGTIDVVDVLSGGVERSLIGHYSAVAVVVWHPDGTTLASGGRDCAVRLWDIATGDARILGSHDREVRQIAFRPDGARLVSLGDDQKLRVFDVGHRAAVHPLYRVPGLVADSLAWHPAGDRIALSAAGSTRIVGADSGTELANLDGTHLRWSHDGSHYAVHVSGCTKVVAAADGAVVAVCEGAAPLAFWHPDRCAVAVSKRGFGAWIWDPRRAEGPVAVLEGFRRVFWMDWAGDDLVGLSNSLSCFCLAPSLELREPVQDFGYDPLCQALSPDGRFLVMDHSNLQLHLFDRRGFGIAARLVGHDAQPRAIAWSPDGARMASSADDGTLRLWDPQTAEEVFALQLGGPVGGFAWSPCGQRIAAVVGDAIVMIDAR